MTQRRGVRRSPRTCLSPSSLHGYRKRLSSTFLTIRCATNRAWWLHIFCIVNETTGRVVGERRLRTLRAGPRHANRATRSRWTTYSSSRRCVPAENPHDVPFACFYRPTTLPAIPWAAPPASAWPLARAAAFRQPMVDPPGCLRRSLPCPAARGPSRVQSVVVLPIVHAGAAAPHAFFVAGVSHAPAARFR